MSRLQISDITFPALRKGVYTVKNSYNVCRLELEETSTLTRILYEDAHRSSEELVDYQTVYDYVYAKMRRWGYIKSPEPSVPPQGTLSLRLRPSSRRKPIALTSNTTAQQTMSGAMTSHVSYETSSEDEMTNEEKDARDYCRVLS